MTPTEQLQFLTQLQRLLSEGQFVATYKYALVLALSDLSVEKQVGADARLKLSTHEIAEKFIHYYWRQASPYEGRIVLRHTTGPKQAAVITKILRMRDRHGGSLFSAQNDACEWQRLVSKVAEVVEDQPLWKLQTMGGEQVEFLYPNVGRGHEIELLPGVAHALRLFRPLIGDLVRGSWLTHIRRFNLQALGSSSDLQEFLFGSERGVPQAVGPILMDLQQGRCFYCQGGLSPKAFHIDHFIPWSRYQADLGHNFVLADERCNLAKSDSLADVDHLASWLQRNRQHQEVLQRGFEEGRIVYNEQTSRQIARWAYTTTASVGGNTWVRGKEFSHLPGDWELAFDRCQ